MLGPRTARVGKGRLWKARETHGMQRRSGAMKSEKATKQKQWRQGKRQGRRNKVQMRKNVFLDPSSRQAFKCD